MAKKIVDITSLLLEYDQLRERQKTIKKRTDEVAKYIKDYATKNGAKDQNGSYYSENADFIFGSQARKSVKLKDLEAKEFFKERNLYESVIDVVEVLNEDKIEQLIAEEKITVEDIESISEIKTSYAIDVKVKTKDEVEEVMPEVQVVNSVKRKLPLKKK